MAVQLDRITQTGLKVEASEGTPETLSAADFSGNRTSDDHTYNVGEYERGLKKGVLTVDPVVKAARSLTISWEEELVGVAAAIAADVPWLRSLKGMGFTASQLKVVDISSITNGPFKCGQRIGNNATEGSATVTGTAVAQIGTSKLVYLPGTGSFSSGNTVYNYGQVSQGSATIGSAPSNAGQCLRPISETASTTPPAFTVERRMGGVRHTAAAARGKGSLAMRMNEVPKLSCEYMGCPDLDSNGEPNTQALASNVPAVGVAPLPCKGMPFSVSGFTPVLSQLEIAIENTLAMRGTIADNDVRSSGYIGCRITERKITATIDPEMDLSGTLKVERKTVTGETFELTVQHGSASHGNGLTVIYCPAAQLTGDQSPEARDGISTTPLSMLFTGPADQEISIYHVTVP